jgi:hypothetical protein
LDDESKAGLICKERYYLLRDEVLRTHPWKFAKKRVSLALLDETPVFGYDYAYQLPTDCLRVLGSEYADTEFKVEGRKVLTNETTMYLSYVSRIEDVSQYDAEFCEALACRIAADIAYAITNNASLTETMMKVYREKLAEARSVSAMEGTPDNLVVDDWINARE